MTDQQSADAMSCVAGERFLRTPALDNLAAKGALFSSAYCTHPLCVPSRTAMFSGRYPHQIGVLSNDDQSADMSRFVCLGTLFRDAGYETGYVGKWHLSYPLGDVSGHGFGFRANNRCNRADPGNRDEAVRFLRMQRRAPFFLVVSYNNPHNICEWARGARGPLPDGDISPPPPLGQCPPLKPNHTPPDDETHAMSFLRRSYHASPTFPVGAFGEKEWREYRWAYYRMVETVDRRIGRILDEVNSLGLENDTIVVFVSDHGDAQGAHGWNQKTVLYDEANRVPLIISHPGHVRPGVRNVLTQTGIDLFPTLCDAAGIDVPDDLPGISLMPIARGAREASTRPYIVAETRFVQGAPIDGEVPRADGRMVRSERYKYCIYDMGVHRESLVDMVNDPGEMRNCARNPEYRHILEQHRDYLRSFCSETRDMFPVWLDW